MEGAVMEEVVDVDEITLRGSSGKSRGGDCQSGLSIKGIQGRCQGLTKRIGHSSSLVAR